MSVTGTMSRNRQHNVESNVYNPDLEYAGQGIANEMYGPGAAYGGYGMSGGQFPTQGQDPTGFGTDQYGNPWNFHDRPGGDSSAALANQNYNKFGGGPTTPGGQYSVPSQTAGAGGFRYYGEGGAAGGDLYGGGSSGARQTMGRTAFGTYAGMIANPGYSSEQATRIRTSADTGARSPYERARYDIRRRAGLTGDTGSVAAAEARLAGGEGVAAGDAARGSEIAIANERQRQLEAGAAGAAGMYGQESGFMSGLIGERARLASLKRRTRTEGTATGGQFSGGYNFAGAG